LTFKFDFKVPITSRDEGNLLRDGYLEEVEELSFFIQHNLTVQCDLKSSGFCSFQDICSGNCNDNQVIPIFRLIYRNDSRRFHPNFRLTYPTMHIYNDEYYIGEHFAGISVNRTTNRISKIKLVISFPNLLKLHIKNFKNSFRWEKKLLSYVQSFRHPFINISCSSDGLFSHEVRRNGISCIPYFILSVTAVFSFILITNQRSNISEGLFIAFVGTIGPLMAICTTFTVLLAIGNEFNSITLVVPFLIMGVGCDDVFIIVHAWRKTSSNDLIVTTMSEAGPSITVTSVTNALSFGIGILTSTPAIRLFCIYATLGVLIDFIYQITFFGAAMVYQGPKRIVNESKASDNNRINRWRLMVFAFVITYWLVSIYGCLTMPVKMDSTNLLLRDSPLNNVAWLYEKYLWSEGSLFFVFINNPPELRYENNRNRMLNLVKRFETLEYSMGHNSTSIWLRSFLSQASLYENEQNNDFYFLLDDWLTDEGRRWNDFIRVERFNQTIIGIKRFFFATAIAMGNHSSWVLRARLQNAWRDLAFFYQQYNVTVYQPYSFYVDQLNSIRPTMISTVITAMVAMALICFLTIPSNLSIIFSCLAMLSINIGVFGGLSLWNVCLDPLTMCTTLTSIGFSVDFTVHICYHYYRCSSSKIPEERLRDALTSIGWPMIQAGLSTVLCVSPLLLVDSYMVSVFLKTIFLVISLGLLHGILFLPSLLLTVTPLNITKKKIQNEPGKKLKTHMDSKNTFVSPNSNPSLKHQFKLTSTKLPRLIHNSSM
uniref:SSD domain-containing protein n=1 Tax=Dracunculus medinensis TaxID=318479 RepID=A0A0N4U1D9_DRAME